MPSKLHARIYDRYEDGDVCHVPDGKEVISYSEICVVCFQIGDGPAQHMHIPLDRPAFVVRPKHELIEMSKHCKFDAESWEAIAASLPGFKTVSVPEVLAGLKPIRIDPWLFNLGQGLGIKSFQTGSWLSIGYPRKDFLEPLKLSRYGTNFKFHVKSGDANSALVSIEGKYASSYINWSSYISMNAHKKWDSDASKVFQSEYPHLFRVEKVGHEFVDGNGCAKVTLRSVETGRYLSVDGKGCAKVPLKVPLRTIDSDDYVQTVTSNTDCDEGRVFSQDSPHEFVLVGADFLEEEEEGYGDEF